MRRLLALAVVFVIVVSGCGDSDDTGGGSDGDSPTRTSVAGDWVLTALVVDGASFGLPDDELEITIEAGQISGSLGCNSFFGEIDAADDGSLVLGGLGQTEMACVDDGRMDFEFTYGNALSSATAWAVTPAGLTLSGGAVEVRYEQAPPPVHQSLLGTVWHFDTIYEGSGPDGSASNRADMDGVTLVIGAGVATVFAPDCGDVAVDVDVVEGNYLVGLALAKYFVR